MWAILLAAAIKPDAQALTLSNASVVGDKVAAPDAQCQDELAKLNQDAALRDAALACETKKNLTNMCVEAMKQSDYAHAEELTQQSFEDCGGVSNACAKQVVPEAVMAMRMTGAGVSAKCDGELASVRDDMEVVQKHALCEASGGYLEKIVEQWTDIQNPPPAAAVETMATDLHTCTEGKISATCADQLSPPVLHLLRVSAAQAQEQQPQVDMIVFTETASEISKVNLTSLALWSWPGVLAAQKGPDCACVGKEQGPDCACVGKEEKHSLAQKGPDCACVGKEQGPDCACVGKEAKKPLLAKH